jgi:sec-independent protein translocase protein TatC
MKDDAKPFMDHLQELRNRLWCVLFFVVIGSAVGYFFYPAILGFLLRPLHQPLYYSSPIGGFDLMFKVCVMTGVLLAMPVLLYHVFRFLAPVLPVQSHWTVIGYIIASYILLFCSSAFAYFICLPSTFAFLNEFNSAQVHSLISSSEYFSFLQRYVIGFGIVCQMPVVLLLLNKAHRLPVRKVLSAGRYVIVGSFILAAMLSPSPDAFNQTAIAIPIICLFYGSALFLWWSNGKHSSQQSHCQQQKLQTPAVSPVS